MNPKISALISVQRLDFWNGSVSVTSNQDICLKLAMTNQKFVSWSVAKQIFQKLILSNKRNYIS